MNDIDFDKHLTELAFRLTGEDRFTVLEAASKLRRMRQEAVRAIEALRLV